MVAEELAIDPGFIQGQLESEDPAARGGLLTHTAEALDKVKGLVVPAVAALALGGSFFLKRFEGTAEAATPVVSVKSSCVSEDGKWIELLYSNSGPSPVTFKFQSSSGYGYEGTIVADSDNTAGYISDSDVVPGSDISVDLIAPVAETLLPPTEVDPNNCGAIDASVDLGGVVAPASPKPAISPTRQVVPPASTKPPVQTTTPAPARTTAKPPVVPPVVHTTTPAVVVHPSPALTLAPSPFPIAEATPITGTAQAATTTVVSKDQPPTTGNHAGNSSAESPKGLIGKVENHVPEEVGGSLAVIALIGGVLAAIGRRKRGQHSESKTPTSPQPGQA